MRLPFKGDRLLISLRERLETHGLTEYNKNGNARIIQFDLDFESKICESFRCGMRCGHIDPKDINMSIN
ncbi:CLUMA_CG013708, isoform A [Clunio marinus]|uniref:CLUMA_CG013708, isoform A n=1 Tax=Clunio marinus TaxID=568069 RepID=A0A1J1IJM7_9DIPT|nr:CLUMA_CG013708, isoform A [Clunio marinus]